jgi:hypothetical protein
MRSGNPWRARHWRISNERIAVAPAIGSRALSSALTPADAGSVLLLPSGYQDRCSSRSGCPQSPGIGASGRVLRDARSEYKPPYFSAGMSDDLAGAVRFALVLRYGVQTV